MKNLLKFEFRKLGRQKSFYISLIIMAVLTVMAGISYMILLKNADAIEEGTGQLLPRTSTEFLLLFTKSSMFAMLSAIFTSITVCDDYESQIVKNIFARGYPRTDYYFAKLIYVFVATTLMFLFALAVGAVAGIAFFGFESVSGKLLILLLGQYVICMAGVAMCFAISAAIKKLGGVIAANIIVPIIIPLILQLGDSVLKIKDFKITSVWADSFLTSLTDINVSTGRIIVCILGAAAYTIAFIVAGFAATKRAEV